MSALLSPVDKDTKSTRYCSLEYGGVDIVLSSYLLFGTAEILKFNPGTVAFYRRIPSPKANNQVL